MKKTTEYTAGVMAVTDRAREFNPEIGFYEEHFVNEDFGFTVRLSNKGAIRMSREIAQDYESQPSSVTPERVMRVAATFWRIGE